MPLLNPEARQTRLCNLASKIVEAYDALQWAGDAIGELTSPDDLDIYKKLKALKREIETATFATSDALKSARALAWPEGR